jgi:fatty-acyl-CoA synthase
LLTNGKATIASTFLGILNLTGLYKSAIVAGPDDKWGERPVAFVVLKVNRTIDEKHVIDHCRKSLAGYKVM